MSASSRTFELIATTQEQVGTHADSVNHQLDQY